MTALMMRGSNAPIRAAGPERDEQRGVGRAHTREGRVADGRPGARDGRRPRGADLVACRPAVVRAPAARRLSRRLVQLAAARDRPRPSDPEPPGEHGHRQPAGAALAAVRHLPGDASGAPCGRASDRPARRPRELLRDRRHLAPAAGLAPAPAAGAQLASRPADARQRAGRPRLPGGPGPGPRRPCAGRAARGANEPFGGVHRLSSGACVTPPWRARAARTSGSCRSRSSAIP